MIEQLWSLISAGNGIAIALLVLTWAQTLIQPSSKFPVSVPERFQPLVAVVTGQLYAVLLVVAAHKPWGIAAAYGVAATIVALFTSHAIWEGGNTPPWAKAMVFLLDQLRGDAHSAAHPNPPTPPKSGGMQALTKISGATFMLFFVAMLSIVSMAFLAVGVGCTKQQEVALENAGEKAGVCVLDAEMQALEQGASIDIKSTALRCALSEAGVLAVLEESHKVSDARLKAAHCGAVK